MNGLVRTQNEKMMAGVSGALAERFSINIMVVRVLFVLAALANGLGVLLYLLLWLIIPAAPAAVVVETPEAS